jgi:hypothetical protein
MLNLKFARLSRPLVLENGVMMSWMTYKFDEPLTFPEATRYINENLEGWKPVCFSTHKDDVEMKHNEN